MPRRKNKTKRLPRGCRGVSSSNALVDSPQDTWHDLDVPLITLKNNSTNTHDLSLFWHYHDPILQRLYSTGYSVVAMSHTVFGKMDLQRDAASNRFPSSLTFPHHVRPPIMEKSTSTDTEDERHPKKSQTNLSRSPMRILKRLNVIIEQVSDLTYYSLPLLSSTDTSTTIHNSNISPCHDFLREYDIIAISPRNGTVFSSICTTAHLLWVDLITLDYIAGRGGIQLPFSLKSSLVSSAISQGLMFEIPYSPAIMDSSKRKALVQTMKQYQMAIMAKSSSSSSSLPLVISSGNRRRTMSDKNDDVGPLALRQPGDLQNFFRLVLGLQEGKGMKEYAHSVVQRGQGWKKWNRVKQHTSLSSSRSIQIEISIEKAEIKKTFNEKIDHNDMEEENMGTKRQKISREVDMDDDLHDGFLRLS